MIHKKFKEPPSDRFSDAFNLDRSQSVLSVNGSYDSRLTLPEKSMQLALTLFPFSAKSQDVAVHFANRCCLSSGVSFSSTFRGYFPFISRAFLHIYLLHFHMHLAVFILTTRALSFLKMSLLYMNDESNLCTKDFVQGLLSVDRVLFSHSSTKLRSRESLS